MNAAARRIRLGIFIFAAVLLAGLLALRWAGIDQTLLRILAIATGLLVTMLLITYRALLKMAEAARDQTGPPLPRNEDDR